MRSTIQGVEIPGVGLRSVFTTSEGVEVGVLEHNSGDKEVLVYSAEDPDMCTGLVRLDSAEAQVLADLLSVTAPGPGDRLVAGGLVVAAVEVDEGWWVIGRKPEDIEDGVSVVAAIRDGGVMPLGASPTFMEGDVLLLAGPTDAVDRMASLMKSGP